MFCDFSNVYVCIVKIQYTMYIYYIIIRSDLGTSPESSITTIKEISNFFTLFMQTCWHVFRNWCYFNVYKCVVRAWNIELTVVWFLSFDNKYRWQKFMSFLSKSYWNHYAHWKAHKWLLRIRRMSCSFHVKEALYQLLLRYNFSQQSAIAFLLQLSFPSNSPLDFST